jgi:sortase A
MSMLLRRLGTLVIVLGLATAAWAVVVWRWQDPFTALYTTWKQDALQDAYAARVDSFGRLHVTDGDSLATVRREIALEAGRYRHRSRRSQAIARIRIARLDLDMIVVNGVDSRSLRVGPGRDLRTYMPGEGQLVYVAGHRALFGAPFAHIDRLRRGDVVTLELPYAIFRYAVTGHSTVSNESPNRLRSRGRETLTLESASDRFRSSHRYLVFAHPISVSPRGGRTYRPA